MNLVEWIEKYLGDFKTNKKKRCKEAESSVLSFLSEELYLNLADQNKVS